VEPDDLKLLFELFENTPRQGPGSVETIRRALRSLPDPLRVERVLDLGCGTGGSTLVLAEDTGAHVTASDIHPPFLATLRARAEERGLAGRITTVAADMADAASLGTGFDLVWAEGSAYSIGVENALRLWRPLLRPGGCLVLTEMVWFVAEPSERARAFFASEYPDTACRPTTGTRTTPASRRRCATRSRGVASSNSTPPCGSSVRSTRPAATSTATCAWCCRPVPSRRRPG
jgi:SAM-dependent methyltransferase